MGTTGGLFSVDGVVVRLSSAYDADEADVADEAARIFEERYAQARVQSFVPILIEKELRDRLRTRRANSGV